MGFNKQNIRPLHLISVHPPPLVEDLTFSSYPRRSAKIAFHKIWVYPWRIGSYPWRIWVYPWRILWKLRLHPQRIPYFFTLPLKKSSIFITYPWRIPWFLNRGVADIKCNSPLLYTCMTYIVTLFGRISLPSLHDWDMKFPIWKFFLRT